MKCAYSRDLLALFVEGDLEAKETADVARHLRDCAACAAFCDGLRSSQAVFKSLRAETPTSAALANVRHEVLARTADPAAVLTPLLAMERLVRRPRLAAAYFAVIAILSVSVLAQLRGSEADRAIFDGENALLLPADYPQWVSLGSSGPAEHGAGETAHRVYMNPEAFETYSSTGMFPEGTVMVLEIAGLDSVQVEASVKDTARFGGWGYFGFSEPGGGLRDRAQVLPEARGCRSCHEQRAETDHVFTQFYPILRSAG